MDYLLHLVVLVCLFVLLAESLDLVAGHMGFISLAHASFYGLGAYTSSLVVLHWHAPVYAGLLAAVLVGLGASLFLSIPSLRLQEDYFVVASLAFQMVLYSTFHEWSSLTGGVKGVSDIPTLEMHGLGLSPRACWVMLVGGVTIVWHCVMQRIIRSPFGRVLHAIREDELVAEALGKNCFLIKVQTFALSSAVAAIAGGLYAHYTSYIDPGTFAIGESVLVVAMVSIGGPGTQWGPVIGALALVTLPESLRFVGVFGNAAANIRQLTYGALLVVMIALRPNAIDRSYSRRRNA